MIKTTLHKAEQIPSLCMTTASDEYHGSRGLEKVMKFKIRTISVLLSVINAMTVATLPGHSSRSKQSAQLSGTVVDVNDARVSGATVTVEGEGATRTVTTAEDGTYRIDLPTGIYRIRVNSRGFCPARRAPFRVQPPAAVMLNFVLTVCPLIHEMKIVNGQYVEVASYLDPFREEVFPLVHLSGSPLELLLRYKERREDGRVIEYRETALSYDALIVRAEKVRLDPRIFRVEAEGNVVVEDGKRSVRGRRAVVELQTGEPKFELTP